MTSIRLHWDQGSLLKQVDVIGSRNRSWPIRDGKEQIKLIISVVGTPEPSTASERRSIQSDARPAVRSHASSVTSVFTNEPRSLSLFENASHTEDEVPTSAGGPVVSPRAAAKPPSRGLEAILSGDGEEPVEQPEFRSPSPKKQFNGQGGTQRHGSEKHFQPIRLFDENDAPPNAKSPDAFKTDPRKYQHFEFGSGEDAVRLSTKQTNKTKHGSQWDFNDFMTPDKPREPRLRTQDVRNFGWEDNEVTQARRDPLAKGSANAAQEKSPVRRPVVHHARPDAETHFEFVDDGTPEPSKARPTSKGRQHNEGLGLYRDNVLDPDGAAAPGKQPLAHTSVNVNADSRHRDFDSKFEMVDDSPSTRADAAAARNDENAPAQPAPKKIDDNRAKVVKMMASSWQSYDDGAEGAPAARKENAAAAAPPHDEKKVRRDAERHWGFGDDDADVVEEHSKKIVPSGAPQAAEKSFWDF